MFSAAEVYEILFLFFFFFLLRNLVFYIKANVCRRRFSLNLNFLFVLSDHRGKDQPLPQSMNFYPPMSLPADLWMMRLLWR